MDFIDRNLNLIIAGGIVLAVILLALLVYRALVSTIRGRRGSRLGISEYHEIDKIRRLVLIRRDGVEHLLMIGGPEDVVVETGIMRNRPETAVQEAPQPARAPALEAVPVPDEESRPIPLRAAPRPAVFGERKPSLRPIGRDEPRFQGTRPTDTDS